MKNAIAAKPATSVNVRRLLPTDSAEAITALLHRAYRPQVEMGLRPLAGRQDAATTRVRAANSECYVAEADGAIAGVILFEEKEEADFPHHFLKPEVAHFSQFAVDPEVQGRGIGRALLETVEKRARAMGFAELALSMAEPDAALMDFYLNRGFRFVEHWQWPYTNYRSVILSKALNGQDA
jgi:GNAT superfamily N-acetyltransferase